MFQILITVASILTLYLLYLYKQFRDKIDLVPGPKVDSILLGNLNLLIKHPKISKFDYLKEFYPKFNEIFNKFRQNGVFRFWMGPLNVVYILTNAESAECLLTSNANIDKGFEYKFMSPWLGDGLLLANSSIWKPRRKMLTPAFHFKILKNFIPIFSTHTEKLIKSIEEKCQIGSNTKMLVENIRPLFENFTLDIIKETALGVENDPTMNMSYREALKNSMNGAFNRVRNPLYWIDSLFALSQVGKKFYDNVAILQNYSDKIIQERIEDFPDKLNNNIDSKSENVPIFIDILLEKFYQSNVQEVKSKIQSEVNTFIIGGYETTAMTLIFTILWIGREPTIQDKIYKELDEVFNGDMQKEIEFDDLREMRYLELCIKETLRMYPSVQMVGRRLTTPMTLPCGATLPVNSSCYIPIYYLHTDPKYFPQPEKYIPERFSPEQQSSITNAYAYIPFSAGTRNCIGQKYAMLELKYVLASILRRFRVHSNTVPSEVVKLINPVIKPLTKIEVVFESI